MELRHSQKLEAVGSLASGIAHEINTLVQFVGDSLQFIRESFSDISDLLQKFEQACKQINALEQHPKLAAMIHEAKDDADLDYLLENDPEAFERIQEGMDRVAEIVRAMKQFGYTDTKDKTTADLKKAIENTLVVCRNEYKYVADVTTEFAPMPLVPCHLGDINQVFLNLIVNAAHAIGDAIGDSGEKGSIHIKTGQASDHVWIAISDSGCGIDTGIQDRVFDPFFTTKEVGKGTGQRLTIARNIIVDKHGGNLRFESTPGKGTTFTVELPLADQSKQSPT